MYLVIEVSVYLLAKRVQQRESLDTVPEEEQGQQLAELYPPASIPENIPRQRSLNPSNHSKDAGHPSAQGHSVQSDSMSVSSEASNSSSRDNLSDRLSVAYAL